MRREVFWSNEEFGKEEKAIKNLQNLDVGLKVLKLIDFPEAKPNTIRFSLVGHRVRLNSACQFKAALDSLSEQLTALHSKGFYHGDVSARNIMMCVTGGAGYDADTAREGIDAKWQASAKASGDAGRAKAFFDEVAKGVLAAEQPTSRKVETI